MVAAKDVAAALRARMPGLGKLQVHKLLYLAQGHHLGTFGVPLFDDTISAFDLGPVVTAVWHADKEGVTGDPDALEEGELNTVGYVLSRYGGLSGADLVNLTHGQAPWRDADARRLPGTSVKIEKAAIREYFRTADLEDDTAGDAELLDADTLGPWLRRSAAQQSAPAHPDSIERLKARLVR